MKQHKHIRLLTILCTMLITIFAMTGCNNTSINDMANKINDKYSATTESPSDKPSSSDKSDNNTSSDGSLITTTGFDLSKIPEFNNSPIYEYNDNKPLFTSDEITSKAYENYADLDNLGRVQTAMACLGEETLPTSSRGDINSVTPTGWKQKKYDTIKDGGYLYNRCHLIAHELAGEDANEKNLATGTRYMNVSGMLPYENLVRAYIDDTGNHVMYRVTPMFIGEELVCRGVLIEAYSVEDNGEGIKFCIYCYNNQPGITIDYTTGESHLSTDTSTKDDDVNITSDTYILNTKNKVVHKPTCSSVDKMSESNKKTYTGSLSDLLNEGYKTCGSCHPEK